ncbi:Alpha,alpha-trehalose-phosphate synthase [Minicystis rosea]|nr:Alpha,alpha-trehalose-phosphate synthase [Minicystis rosea]
MPRLLLVSNRLPVTVVAAHGEATVARSSGGLATALAGPHTRRDARWIGWPGDLSHLTSAARDAVLAELTMLRTVPVTIPPEEAQRFYDGFSNGVLWPLFHYLLDKVNLDARADWEAYRDVNERFADVVAKEAEPGDAIWVHDYQLALLPEMLRKRLPRASVGFFLHIPFPASDVFRILPWRAQILRGMLGADRIGFHTAAYRQNFVSSAARVLGLEPDIDALVYEDRRVELGVHPVGVDAARLSALAQEPRVIAEAQRIRDDARGRRIVLGIDRLDYTKGIPRRLLAIERLLEREPSLQTEVRFIQLAVPTRERVEAYADFRRLVNEMVGRINGRFGSVDAVPIHFLHQSLAEEQLVALYLAADVMLVTPLRDGMNLVAKEFVASRHDEAGALVLSEFAGAAAELSEALLVNPYDLDAVVDVLKRAISMSRVEQRLRMSALRRRIAEADVDRWTEGFLADLDRTTQPVDTPPPELPAHVMAAAQEAEPTTLLLDYDGTLVPIETTPDLAAPDEDLRELLAALAARAGLHVHVVSGRRREDLDRFLGALPIGLHAEHGYWSRPAGGAWTPLETIAAEWKAAVRAVLRRVTSRTAGSFIEEKTASLAWHYRQTDPDLGRVRLGELREALAAPAHEGGLELLAGAKVLEIRPRNVHKGRVVPAILAEMPGGSAVVAIGDDRTDEDLFAALPVSALTIHVGAGASRAIHTLSDPAAVRRFLRGYLRS